MRSSVNTTSDSNPGNGSLFQREKILDTSLWSGSAFVHPVESERSYMGRWIRLLEAGYEAGQNIPQVPCD